MLTGAHSNLARGGGKDFALYATIVVSLIQVLDLLKPVSLFCSSACILTQPADLYFEWF